MQEWCQQAEATGIETLKRFSAHLAYVPQQVGKICYGQESPASGVVTIVVRFSAPIHQHIQRQSAELNINVCDYGAGKRA